jgi:mannose-6-phosphate isomerase-like protein (cupin superfamily)
VSFINPEIKHYFGGGVYAKETIIPAGNWLVQHIHHFDHLSILAQGSVELITEETTVKITAPACITLRAGIHHGVRSLTDVIWYCIHATDCVDETEIDSLIIAPAIMHQVKTIAQALRKEN